MLLLLSASLLAFAPPAQKKTTWQELRAREYQYTFDEYLAEYRKTYVGAAYDARRRIFEDALATIREHNENSGASWKMGLSPHSDRTEEEWRALKGLKHVGTPPEGGVEASGRGGLLGRTAWGDLPDSVDWREKGVVSAVKNQQSCGSCWAFAATETVESAVAIATGTLPILAPQQYVDCAPNPEHCGGTGGCAGSTQWLAFNYTLGVGLTASADYPYDARDGVCHAAPAVAGITGYKRLPSNDYGALMHAVATVGPIAISVDASWQMYEEGVYDGTCGTDIDHAVQLVGYGTDGGKDYWLVRNSWGDDWGEDGYIRIRRFGDGKEPCGTDRRPQDGTGCSGGPKTVEVCGRCGILSDSAYPTGAFLY